MPTPKLRFEASSPTPWAGRGPCRRSCAPGSVRSRRGRGAPTAPSVPSPCPGRSPRPAWGEPKRPGRLLRGRPPTRSGEARHADCDSSPLFVSAAPGVMCGATLDRGHETRVFGQRHERNTKLPYLLAISWPKRDRCGRTNRPRAPRPMVPWSTGLAEPWPEWVADTRASGTRKPAHPERESPLCRHGAEGASVACRVL